MSVFTKNKKGSIFTKYRFVSSAYGVNQTNFSLVFIFRGFIDGIDKQAIRQLENNLRIWL